MMRRIWTAALATALAGGVYLAGAPAQASNMGFKLERDFDVVRRGGSPTGTPALNTYWVSLPYFNGMADLANDAGGASVNSVCVGDPQGPTAGDGRINVNDAICDWFEARAVGTAAAGQFSMSYYNTDTCQSVSRLARVTLGVPQFSGPIFPTTGDLRTDIGYQINVSGPTTGGSPTNRAVIVGSHDPSFAGHTIAYTPTCGAGGPPCCNSSRAARVDMLAVPYHSMFQKTIEIACGLRGTDWPDANNDWVPDDLVDPAACDNGIFDGSTTISVSRVVVGDIDAGQTNAFQSQQIRRVAIPPPNGSLQPAPLTPYDLIPGDAYLIGISQTQQPRTFLSPHF